jgi:ADP-ribosyltransferase exoenzyme
MYDRPKKIMQLKMFLAEEMKLSESEALAVILFKNGYKSLNEKIRKGKLSADEQLFCNNLNAGLVKLPKTTANTIFRNLNFYDFQLKTVGRYFKDHLHKHIRFSDFQSCTLREDFTGNDHLAYNCTLKISVAEDTNGVDIHSLWNKFDLNDSEQEILMPGNSCFEVTAVKINKRLTVHLREVKDIVGADTVPDF